MTEENLLQLGVGSMVIHPSFGRGILVEESDKSYKIFFYDIDKAKEIDRTYDKLDIITKTAPQQTLAPIELKDIEELFLTTVFKYFDPPINIPLAGKWIDGKIIITSGDTSLQPKEIPTESVNDTFVLPGSCVVDPNCNTFNNSL